MFQRKISNEKHVKICKTTHTHTHTHIKSQNWKMMEHAFQPNLYDIRKSSSHYITGIIL